MCFPDSFCGLNVTIFAGIIIVEVVVNGWMTDFVSGFDDLGNIVGNLVDFAVVGFDEVHFLHLGLKEFVEWLPEALADEEHWHLWHFAFLHKDENFGKFVESTEAAGEEDIDFTGNSKHDFAGKEIAEFNSVGNVWIDMLFVRELNV